MQLWNRSGDRKALFELMCDEHVGSQVHYVQKDRASKPTRKIGSSSFCIILQNKRSENVTYLAELTSTATFVLLFLILILALFNLDKAGSPRREPYCFAEFFYRSGIPQKVFTFYYHLRIAV